MIPHKMILIADSHAHAKEAARKYAIHAWQYASSPEQLMGLERVTVAFAGPCFDVSAHFIKVVEMRLLGGRINVLHLPT